MPRRTSPRRKSPNSSQGADRVTSGSGNVFADLKLPNPDLALAKAELVLRIRELLAERKLSQVKAGELLGLDQPKVSGLLRGRVEGYSLDRLFRFLNALGQQVEINIRPAERRRASLKRRSIVITT